MHTNGTNSIGLPPLPSKAEVNIPMGEHPYPHRLAQYVREMILAQYTYHRAKIAAMQALEKCPDGLKQLQIELKVGLDGGLREDVFRDHWQFEQRFQGMRRVWDNQAIVVLWSSAWDWFIRQLIEFVTKAELARGREVKYQKIVYAPFKEQIAWLDRLCNSSIPGQQSLDAVDEMICVRNLGLHNAWEVDRKYLHQHRGGSFQLGQIRAVKSDELLNWQRGILAVLDHYASAVAKRFSDALELGSGGEITSPEEVVN